MEEGLLDAVVKMYRAVSGDETATPESIALEFTETPITEPLDHYSRISGKMPTGRHILDGELPKANIKEILSGL
jgi:hypothetical protein